MPVSCLMELSFYQKSIIYGKKAPKFWRVPQLSLKFLLNIDQLVNDPSSNENDWWGFYRNRYFLRREFVINNIMAIERLQYSIVESSNTIR